LNKCLDLPVDKNNISRERLAFHVHACATSFASLAPLSSWIGFEISLIQDAYSALEASGADLVGMGWQTSPFLVFIRSIPGRFYPIYLLVFIFLLILYNREFGPMYTAEKRALGGKVVADTASTAQTEVNPQMEPEADTPLLWWNGAIPIATTVALIILGLVLTGQQAARADGLELTAANIFGNSDSFLSLLWGSFGGLVSCFFLFLLQHKRLGRLVPPSWLRFVGCGACGARAGSRPLLTWHECMHWFVEGIKSLTTAVLVLVLAWSIGTALEACGTGAYVSQGLAGNIAGGSIPVLTFVLAACISFATGTSWGTMAILFPIAVPTQYAATTPPDEGLVTLTIAAILAGSIFGDQTTLISDSTILTCLSTRCDIRQGFVGHIPVEYFACH
jgi:Na+/H+ antiporter NhaC